MVTMGRLLLLRRQQQQHSLPNRTLLLLQKRVELTGLDWSSSSSSSSAAVDQQPHELQQQAVWVCADASMVFGGVAPSTSATGEGSAMLRPARNHLTNGPFSSSSSSSLLAPRQPPQRLTAPPLSLLPQPQQQHTAAQQRSAAAARASAGAVATTIQASPCYDSRPLASCWSAGLCFEAQSTPLMSLQSLSQSSLLPSSLQSQSPSLSSSLPSLLLSSSSSKATCSWRGMDTLFGLSAAQQQHRTITGSSSSRRAVEGSGQAEGGATQGAAEAEGVGASSEGAEEEVGEEGGVAGEVAELKQRLLLAYADMENLRERSRREVENVKLYAVQGFAKELLDVADNLSRASTAAASSVSPKPGDATPSGPEAAALRTLLEGVQMTEKQLLQVFRRHGLVRVYPAGEAFDPNLHEAMFEVEDANVYAGTIVHVLKPGYTIHGRVLRAAEVGVAKGGKEREESPKDAGD